MPRKISSECHARLKSLMQDSADTQRLVQSRYEPIAHSISASDSEKFWCKTRLRWDSTNSQQNVLQSYVDIWHCNTLQLQHTATHCNTLQHTATHCNTWQHNVLQSDVDILQEIRHLSLWFQGSESDSSGFWCKSRLRWDSTNSQQNVLEPDADKLQENLMQQKVIVILPPLTWPHCGSTLARDSRLMTHDCWLMTRMSPPWD